LNDYIKLWLYGGIADRSTIKTIKRWARDTPNVLLKN
jgi:hypothetical protein